MAKFSIKRNPTFNASVPLPVVGGDPVKVEFTFKYLDRTALANFQQSRFDFASSLSEKFGEGAKMGEVAKSAIDYEFDQLKAIVADWDIDEEFNDENLRAFVESSSQTVAAVVDAYMDSYQAARQGN